MKKNLSYILLFCIYCSCNSVKYVDDEDYLLTKNRVYIENKKSFQSELKDYVIQRPNSKLLGIPFALHFYNFGNIDYEQDYLKYTEEHPAIFNSVDKLFSTKQALSLGRSYGSINRWFIETGEAPVVFDPFKAIESVENIQQFYFNKGYFDAEVDYQLIPLKKQKAKVFYSIKPGEIYKIDSISRSFPNPIVDSIYYKKQKSSIIKQGEGFSTAKIEQEANRLVNLYRNNGIYHFNKNLIRFGIDTSFHDKSAKVVFQINQRVDPETNSILPLKPQKVSKVSIYSDYTYNRRIEPYRDTVSFEGFEIYSHEKLNYNPRVLTNSIFIKPNSLYSDANRNLTRTHLRSLNNFKSVKVIYEEIDDEQLLANIYLTPLKKYNVTLNNEITHSNIKNFGIAGKFSFLNRNTFKQAEIFKLSFSGSFFNTSADVSDPRGFFNAWELGVDASLELPKVLLPFRLSKIIAKEKYPKTVLSIGTSVQKNIGLDNQKYTAIYDLGWQANQKLKHQIELFNVQYVKNLNIDEYFNIYQSEFNELQRIQEDFFPGYEPPLTEDNSVSNAIDFIDFAKQDEAFEQNSPQEYQEIENIEKRYTIITDNNFIPTLAYSLTYTTQEGLKDRNFSYTKIRFANAGALGNLFAKKPENGEPNSLFGAPIAQYFKLDLEYKKFWDLGENKTLAFRVFGGFALPYGNSTDLPFSRSYFVGGANDMRAWEIYELGPGASLTGLEYNVGSMKLLSSLEYRFKLIGKLKGAFFIDAGNIWDISKSELNSEEGRFEGLSSLKNTAVGSGFGARYDFSFLILRLDFGFKTYEPYLETGSRWFQNYNFANAVYNIGINYPF